MKCFDTPRQLKTMAALAAEFVVCDRWFSSVPGPTWPNRLFVHAATSFGFANNRLGLYSGPTIYDRLDSAGVDWAIYFHEYPQSACLHELWDRRDSKQRKCMRPIDDFYQEVRSHRLGSAEARTLPSYVFIEPCYIDPGHGIRGWFVDLFKSLAHLLGFPVRLSKTRANDQHAPHDVRLGEHLIADIYQSLRANEDVWQHCLFLVLHDEHGGLFDHVPPPAVKPEQHSSTAPSFAFDRLGLRVPAIVVSPYVQKGVEHTQYEHASIVKTVREHFCPDAAPLNARDAAAPALRRGLFTEAPRADAPAKLTRPTPVFAIPRRGAAAAQGLNDLQASLVRLSAAVGAAPVQAPRAGPGVSFGIARAPGGVIDLTGPEPPAGMTEAEARRFVEQQRQRSRP
jgi:phospholipase C